MASLSTKLSDPLTSHVIGCRRCASSTVLDEDTAGDGAASDADIPRRRWGHFHGGRRDCTPCWRVGKYGSEVGERRAQFGYRTLNAFLFNKIMQ